MSRLRALSLILAGGEGKRLQPLTRDRAKPAVPFGGRYRLIDYALSNLVNADLRRVVVLTQYKSQSLHRHLSQAWALSPLLGEYIASVPPQMRVGTSWFTGSADAIYQNLNIIDDEQPEYVIVFSADHIYRIDARQFLEHHVRSGAGVTVACVPVPFAEGSKFGVLDSDSDGRIREFQEKPAEPAPMPAIPPGRWRRWASISSRRRC